MLGLSLPTLICLGLALLVYHILNPRAGECFSLDLRSDHVLAGCYDHRAGNEFDYWDLKDEFRGDYDDVLAAFKRDDPPPGAKLEDTPAAQALCRAIYAKWDENPAPDGGLLGRLQHALAGLGEGLRGALSGPVNSPLPKVAGCRNLRMEGDYLMAACYDDTRDESSVYYDTGRYFTQEFLDATASFLREIGERASLDPEAPRTVPFAESKYEKIIGDKIYRMLQRNAMDHEAQQSQGRAPDGTSTAQAAAV